MAKDRRERVADAAVLLFVVREFGTGTSGDTNVATATEQRRRRAQKWWAAAAALVAIGAATVVAVAWPEQPLAPAASYHFPILAPSSDATFDTPAGGGTGIAPQLAISPDGRTVVFVARRQGEYQLWRRPLASTEAYPIPGTVGGAFPFWSPDSQQIAFFAGGKLKRVALDGSRPTDVAEASAGRGGTWRTAGVILFAPSAAGVLQTVPASGGTPADVTTLDAEYGETSHRFPVFLPDGRHFLYTGVTGTCCPPTKPARLQVGSLGQSKATVLAQVESWATYEDGHLIYNHDGTLLARPFDASARSFSGDPLFLVEGVAFEGSRYASFAAGAGILVYALGDIRPRTRLTWFSRSGQRLRTVGTSGSHSTIALSPDERRLAISKFSPDVPSESRRLLDRPDHWEGRTLHVRPSTRRRAGVLG